MKLALRTTAPGSNIRQQLVGHGPTASEKGLVWSGLLLASLLCWVVVCFAVAVLLAAA